VKRAFVCGMMVALAALVHALAGRYLAGHDVVLALLVGGRVGAALVVLALLLARLFLYVLAPGWALYVGVMLAVERYRRPR
jgi:hypothetical protein